MRRRVGFLLIGLLALSLGVTACGTPPPEEDIHSSPLALSPLPTPTNLPAPTLAPTLASPPPMPAQLVVLHTNDNWGEVDPCG